MITMNWLHRCCCCCCGWSVLLLLLELAPLQAVEGATFNVIGEERRSYDGKNNNLRTNPLWGSIDQPRIRHQVPPYLQTPPPRHHHHERQLPSARRVMEDIFHKAAPRPDKTTNHLLLEFGHFLVQDMLGSSDNATDPMPIPCDGRLTDYVFCPAMRRRQRRRRLEEDEGEEEDAAWSIYNYNVPPHSIPFFRQTHTIQNTSATTTILTQPTSTLHTSSSGSNRYTINGMTSFLDLSNLYGLSLEKSFLMRDNRQPGKFYMEHNLPPPDSSFYLPPSMTGGMNTSPGAYAFYVLFMRYHNRVADQLYDRESATTEDHTNIFEQARQQTIAVYQKLVEEAYLPTLLGDKLDPYGGYAPDVDPSMDEFFSAVSFRYAHTAFSGLVRMVDRNFVPTPEDPLLLREVFKQDVPSLVANHGGLEPFIRGLLVTPAKAMDASFVNDLNVWSQATSVVDVQRGRDVGIPSYNVARQHFGLPRIDSLEELAEDTDNANLLTALQQLYHNDIDLLDAYVGAVMEQPTTKLDSMGPLFTRSIKDQFTRLRDGDRFWYKNIYDPEVYQNFPTMSEFIKLLCSEDGMELFPDDAFLLANPKSPGTGAVEDGGGCAAPDESAATVANQLSFLNGDVVVRWQIEDAEEPDPTAGDDDDDDELPTETTIDVTLAVMEPMEGPGYIGIGWKSRKMKGADIWFCTVDYERLIETQGGLSTEGCSSHDASPPSSAPATTTQSQQVISCCLAPDNDEHDIPACSDPGGDDLYYSLEVVDWCLSEEESSVTIRALVCHDGDDGNNSTTATSSNHNNNDCFALQSTQDGRMDVCVAYNPFSHSRPHGYQRRTGARIDLRRAAATGNGNIIVGAEATHPTAVDGGLIATHGAFMLIGWVFLAPIGVYVVRYMKTKTWRLVFHISIMGFIGSMMIPLLIGVIASVGDTDKTIDHNLVGLIILGIFFLMAATGRFRYIKWQGHKLGKKTDLITLLIHRIGGVTFIVLAWWNCYTGLVRISPDDDPHIEWVVLNSYSMGYDIAIFGFIKKYIYGPWIALVITVFVVAEFRKRRSGSAQAKMKDNGSLWDDDGSELKTMTLNNFLDVTRLGNCLTIIDGRILDITDFASTHPGGPELLRYVRGSDITEEFLGRQDVEGIRHMHSHAALQLVKTFVVARLVTDTTKSPRGRDLLPALKSKLHFSSVFNLMTQAALPFRRGRVMDVQYLGPSASAFDQRKPVILLRLSLPRNGEDGKEEKVTKLPGCSFRFRGIDKKGIMFEREYTAVRVANQRRTNSQRPTISLRTMDAASGASATAPVPKFLSRRGSFGQVDDEGEECYDFVISLVPGGQMSNFFLGLKTGKLLLAQGPKVSPHVVSIFGKPDWKTVVYLAGGRGIAPALQVIDFYLQKEHRDEIPFMFLIWVVKSPRHSFNEALGLKHRVRASAGRLKLITIFSSVGEDRSSDSTDYARDRMAETSNHSTGSKRNYGSARNWGWRRASQSGRPSWARASQQSNWMMDALPERRTSVATDTRNGVFGGLFGSREKKKAKVRDLIARAQSTGIEGSETWTTTEDSGHQHVLDSDFWIQPVRSINRNLDQPLVEGLLSSAREYTNKMALEASSLHGGCRVRRELSSLTITSDHNAHEKTSSISDDTPTTQEDEKEESTVKKNTKIGSSKETDTSADTTTTPVKDDSNELDATNETAAESVFSETPPEKSIGAVDSMEQQQNNGDGGEAIYCPSTNNKEFEGTLVALSGPPKFERMLTFTLESRIGFPKKQMITFGVGTQHV